MFASEGNKQRELVRMWRKDVMEEAENSDYSQVPNQSAKNPDKRSLVCVWKDQKRNCNVEMKSRSNGSK